MNPNEIHAFESYRPLMFSIAYRMLGSITEAEDILQETFLRYQGTARADILSLKAFLTTTVTRLCLTRLESAQLRRETYIGPWLPEPILTGDDQADPAQHVETGESISMAFLVLLEQLTPLERAVFLLRQVFDYEYAEIGEMLGKDETACRQLFSRAKKHLSDHRPRFPRDPATHRKFVEQFFTAVSKGELNGLLELLAEDVVLWADGGGKTRGAVLKPLHGREAVGRFVLASPRFATSTLEPHIETVNGEPALLLRANGQTVLVVMLAIDQDQVREIRIIGNPDKLKGVNA